MNRCVRAAQAENLLTVAVLGAVVGLLGCTMLAVGIKLRAGNHRDIGEECIVSGGSLLALPVGFLVAYACFGSAAAPSNENTAHS